MINPGPGLLDIDIRSAIEEIKCNKAVGVDDIPIEFWKSLGELSMRELSGLCKQIYESGIWPDYFTKVVMITLPKTAHAVECADHRTISLLSHVAKILLKIITKRVESKVRDYIGCNQFGFRKRLGTREYSVHRNYERVVWKYGAWQQSIYISFVDFEKAFDRVNWIRMMEALKSLGIDWKDRRLIKELYLRQEAVVRIEGIDSDPGTIGRGVRQGCPMSPLLFSIYTEMMMNEAMEGSKDGVRVGGELIRDVRFADDQGMVDLCEEGLQRTMDRLNKTAKEYNMKINVKKTKTMVISTEEGSQVNIIVDGQRVEQVITFKYLGSILSRDGRCVDDVKARIGTWQKMLLTRDANF